METNLLIHQTTVDELVTVIADRVLKIINQSNTDMTSKLLNSRKAADILGISLPTLAKWRNNGIIKGYRLNNSIRYNVNEILNLTTEKK